MASIFEKEYTAIQKKMNRSNIYAVPRITRVVVNVGVGKQRDTQAVLKQVQHDVAAITGQKPHERLARKAVSGFNVRQGNLVGYRVTLRGKRMEQFVQRFVNITLPRVRDFRGIALSSLDAKGNLSVGMKEQLPFPEVHADQTDVIFGLQVTFVTTADNKEEGEALFRALGFPLTKEETNDEDGLLDTAAARRQREEKKQAAQAPSAATPA